MQFPNRGSNQNSLGRPTRPRNKPCARFTRSRFPISLPLSVRYRVLHPTKRRRSVALENAAETNLWNDIRRTIMGHGFKYFNVDASDASERTRVSTRYRNYAVPEQPSIYPCIVSIQLASGPICFWVASLDNWLCAFCRAVSYASIAVRVSNYRKMRGRSRDGQITIVKESQDDGGGGWRCEDS